MSNAMIAIVQARFEKIEVDCMKELRAHPKLAGAHDPVEGAIAFLDGVSNSIGRASKGHARIYRLAMAASNARKVISILAELDSPAADYDQVSLACRLADAAFFTGHYQLRNAAVIGYGQQFAGKSSSDTSRFSVDSRHRQWVTESKRLREKDGVTSRRERARRISQAQNVGFETVRKALQAHGA